MTSTSPAQADRFEVTRFDESEAAAWDRFVTGEAYNGTFIHTRRFLGYHPPGRFADHSLLVRGPGGRLAAVVPACVLADGNRRTFYAHRGATFGGVVVARELFEVGPLRAVIDALAGYWQAEGFDEVVLRQAPSIFSEGSVHSLDYLLGRCGFSRYEELSFVIPLETVHGREPLDTFLYRARRNVIKGLKAGLEVRVLDSPAEVEEFHRILSDNLVKHGARPVHTVAELLDLRERFPGVVQVHGCFLGAQMLGGTMMWDYAGRVLHEQYVCTAEAARELRPANVLNYRMVQEALRRGVRYFSFGISTEDQGRVLNHGLAHFKEGFGARGYLNSTFTRAFAPPPP